MTGTSVYTYAVLLPFGGHREEFAGLRGVGGLPVRPVRVDGLVAAVSDVPADDYGEQELKERMEDLGWLEVVARAHHGVVAARAARTAVLPLRRATVHRDEERLRLMLVERRCGLAALLARLAGHAEWGVKVYVLPGTGTGTGTGTGNGTGTGTGTGGPVGGGLPEAGDGPVHPGRAYLRRRGEQRRSRERVREEAVRTVERLRAELSALASDMRSHRPQSGPLADGPGVNLANDAYLVPEDRAVRFQERVRSLAEAEPGVRIEVTGPWAPYSFAASAADERVDAESA
jgi:hypothetical protein